MLWKQYIQKVLFPKEYLLDMKLHSPPLVTQLCLANHT